MGGTVSCVVAKAAEEGFAAIAESFTEIAEVEEQHELRYRKLLANVENNRVFSRDTPVVGTAATAATSMKAPRPLMSV